MLNSKCSMGVLVRDDAELDQDRRQVIRLAVVLYVLYTYTRRVLFRSYGNISRVVGKSYMEYAINMMKDYFREEKKAINKVFTFPPTILGNSNEKLRPPLPPI